MGLRRTTAARCRRSIFIHTWRANQREPFSALLAHFIRRHKAFLCDKCNAARPFMNIALAARAMNFPSLNCRHKSANIKRIDLHSNYFGNGLHLAWKSAARKRREESGICHSNLWLQLIERTEHALQQNHSRRVIGDMSRSLLGPLVNRILNRNAPLLRPCLCLST
jgi:hypothetical protein